MDRATGKLTFLLQEPHPHFLRHSGAFRFQSRAVDIGNFWQAPNKTHHLQEECQIPWKFFPGLVPSYLKVGENSLYFPANGCTLLLQRARAWELSSVQAKTLPQEWRDMVFGAMSDLSDDSS